MDEGTPLRLLGDRLEAAIGEALAPLEPAVPHRRGRARLAATAVAAGLVLVSAGVVTVSSTSRPDDRHALVVEPFERPTSLADVPSPADPTADLPSGEEFRTQIFSSIPVVAGTEPACAPDGGLRYRCELRRPATGDGAEKLWLFVPGDRRYRGLCGADPDDPLTWRCALDEEVLTSGLLRDATDLETFRTLLDPGG